MKAAYPHAYWISVYEREELAIPTGELPPTLIFEGIDEWVRQIIQPDLPVDILFEKVEHQIKRLLEWEREEAHHQLVLIGTDISKGIVPLEKVDRLTRDVTGWIYQKLVQEAEQVDIIWYGIAQKLK